MTPTEAARRLKALGYEWAVLILDDSGTDDHGPLVAAHNRSIYPSFVSSFRAEGMLAGHWVTQGGNWGDLPGDADLSIAEVEGPYDLDGVMGVMAAGRLPTCPLGIVTNFSTLTRENVKPLIDRNITCLPEAYMNENALWTPDHMDAVARNLGWPTSQPVAGVYPVRGEPAPSYSEWADWPLVDYLAEAVI